MLKKVLIRLIVFTTIFLFSCNYKNIASLDENSSYLYLQNRLQTATTVEDINNKLLYDYEYKRQCRGNYPAGDITHVNFGSYPQIDVSSGKKELINWIVLKKENNKALLLSTRILDDKGYEEINAGKPYSWSNSEIRKWLNSEFFDIAFSNEEKQVILKTKNDDNGWDEITEDMVFLLSEKEVKQYICSKEMMGTITPYAREKKIGQDLGDPKWFLRTVEKEFKFGHYNYNYAYIGEWDNSCFISFRFLHYSRHTSSNMGKVW